MPNEKNRTDLVKFAYELSARRLESQLTAALAADSRALSFAGICLAAAAILCGLANESQLPIWMFVGSAFLVFSAFASWFSARPILFFMPGARFDDFESDIKENADLERVLEQLGSHFDRSSRENEIQLAFNAKIFRAAAILAIIGITFAIVPQIFFQMNG